MSKIQGGFMLKVTEGEFTDSQIIVMLGENGTGKTTFICMLAGLLKPDTVDGFDPKFIVSYKPQKLSQKSQKTVRYLLQETIYDKYNDAQLKLGVMKPLLIEQLEDKKVVNLFGGGDAKSCNMYVPWEGYVLYFELECRWKHFVQRIHRRRYEGFGELDVIRKHMY